MTKSIRFRLSVWYSAMVFGIGGVGLGAIYLVLRRELRSQTLTGLVVTPGDVVEIGGIGFVMPTIETQQFRTVESMVKEAVLNEIARTTLWALAVLFLLSLAVGWFIAGRALRPIDRITQVAADIQATDLSRRIGIRGPDDELTRLAVTFDSMLDRLDGAFGSQRKFLADTSHDLRNPLAVIRSNVDVSLADPDTSAGEWRETGEIVERAASRMSRMIDDLLAAARLEVGATVAEPLDLAGVVASAVKGQQARLREAGVRLETHLDPAPISGDRTAMMRAVANLIDNALEVSSEGAAISIECGSDAGWCWLGVADRGPGIDPALVDGSARQPVGLGLGIVRQVVMAHRGHTRAYARAAGGSEVVMWIPRDGDRPSGEVPGNRLRLL